MWNHLIFCCYWIPGKNNNNELGSEDFGPTLVLIVSEPHSAHTYSSVHSPHARFHIIGIGCVWQTKWQKFNFINKYTFRFGFGGYHSNMRTIWVITWTEYRILKTPPSCYATPFFSSSYRLIYISKHLKQHQHRSIAQH